MVNLDDGINDVGKFFDKNVDFYGAPNDSIIHRHENAYFVNFMKKNPRKSILDIGGGTGSFIKYLKEMGLDLNVTVIDPSEKALELLNAENVFKIVGSLPYDVPTDIKYSYIHLQGVLHHVTGNSVKKSKKMVLESLKTINNILSDDGYVLLGDIFYESYIVPQFSRNLIKFSLDMQNKLKIKIPADEFINGLDVCFYTRKEFRDMINLCGFEIVQYSDLNWESSLKKKALLLRNWGNVAFILKKKETNKDNK